MHRWLKQRLVPAGLSTTPPSAWEALLQQVQPYTLSDPCRLQNLASLANRVNQQNIPGDFVECGVYKGGSAAILAQHLENERKIWLYDSFAGMPPTTEPDGTDAQAWVGDCVGSVVAVEEVMQLTQVAPEAYQINVGWFQETFSVALPEQVALLHCDADWYESVSLVLETFYPRMPTGACVILDDFGYWEGCREAFYDFCGRHREKPLLERVGSTQAYWIKGKTHNR